MGSLTAFDTLDPHVVLDTQRSAVRLSLYDSLFRWQDGPTRLEPWLAVSYAISEDSKAYRFTMRTDANFHNGRKVTPADVVYSVERILALKQGVAPLLAQFVSPGSTKVVSPEVVEFKLTRPSPVFLKLLAEVQIVNSELLKGHEVNNDWGKVWLRKNAAGSGSYSLRSFDPVGSLVVERFKGHWNKAWGSKPIDEVEYRVMMDPQQRVESLVAGDIHVLSGELLPHQIKQLQKAKSVKLDWQERPRTLIGLLHHGRGAMKELEFRRAVVMAFDAARFRHESLPQPPIAVKLTAPLPPRYGPPIPGAAGMPFDIKAAKASIAKLKKPPGEISIGAIAGDVHSQAAALVMLAGLSEIGLTARIVTEPWPAMATRLNDTARMPDILFYWRGARYLDADNWVGEMYDCELFGRGNSSWYCNTEADQLTKEADAATDPNVRRVGYQKAAAKVAADLASVFVASGKWLVAHSKRLNGLRYSPVGEAIDPREATLD